MINDNKEIMAVNPELNNQLKEDSKLSARSKVLSSWQTSWKSVSKEPPIIPIIPAVDIPMSRLVSNGLNNGFTKSVANDLNSNNNCIIDRNNGLIGDQKTNNEIKNKILSKKCKTDNEIKPKKQRIRRKETQSLVKSNTKRKNHSNHVMKVSHSVFGPNNAFLDSFQSFLKSNPNSSVSAVNNGFTHELTDWSVNPSNDSLATPLINPLTTPMEDQLTTPSVNPLANNVMNNGFKKYIPKPKSDSQIIAEKRVKKLRAVKPIGVKIRRSRTRPLVIKEFSAQKSYMDFLVKKYPPIKEGVPFIQDRSCKDFAKDFESSSLTFCLDCNDKRSDSLTCRFYQYRTLIKINGQLSVYAFAEEGNATQDDCKVWLPVSTPKKLDGNTAKFLLTFVGQELCRIYAEERKRTEQYVSVTWKKPVKGIRELCDVCQTTIFNTHYVCPKCGLAVCVDCYDRRRLEPEPIHNNNRKNHDEFGWLLCPQKQKHDINAFHLAIFITRAVFGSVDTTLHRIRNSTQVMGICGCDRILPNLRIDIRQHCSEIDLKSMYERVPQKWLCDDRLLVLTDPKCEDNLTLFSINWLKGYPVLIQGVHHSLKHDWSPEHFNRKFGKQTSRLVNCMTGVVMARREMSDFWSGFEDVDKRLIDETGEEMILKLKDWPPNAEFRDMLPIWFDDLMDALPLKEYSRYDGKRNLSSRLPEFFVRPDLGPKMYCAYGSVLHPEKGTTNLHLDMSDAVNVMIYVGVAQRNGQPLEEHLRKANETLLRGGCDQQMMDRVNGDGLKVGALWHIWRAEDAEKIREFIQLVAKERHMRRETGNDPIHDQSWYLDQTLRTRLEREYNVKGLALAQCLGDSILVPAGAPHQVQNIHSCIKVAGEFVSPENVSHCLAMTDQFRQLSKRHNNHEDKLQIKNIIYHSVKDAIALLLPAEPLYPVLTPPGPQPHPNHINHSTPSGSSFACHSSQSASTYETPIYCSQTTPLMTPYNPNSLHIPPTPPNSADKTLNPMTTEPQITPLVTTSFAADHSYSTTNTANTVEDTWPSDAFLPPLMPISVANAVESEDNFRSSESCLRSPPPLSIISLAPSLDDSTDPLSPPFLRPFSETEFLDHTISDDRLHSCPPKPSQTQSDVLIASKQTIVETND